MATDPQKIRATKARYCARHKEKIAAYKHDYHIKHRDTINPKANIRAKAWYIKNREKVLAYQAEYAKTHPKEVSIRKRNWERNNPEKKLANTQRRRARKAGAPINDLTAAQWTEIKTAYGHRCVYCGRKMQRLTQDHITPLSKGGAHTASNIVPACGKCNSCKGSRPPLISIQPLLLTVAPSKKKPE